MRLDPLICDKKTLRGSAIETEGGNHRFMAQVTVYARAFGVAMSQTTYDAHEHSERGALKKLLSKLELTETEIESATSVKPTGSSAPKRRQSASMPTGRGVPGSWN